MSGIIAAFFSGGSTTSVSIFTPDGGSVAKGGVISASATLTCAQSATWTWTRTNSVGSVSNMAVSVPSGGSATSIIFTVTAGGSGSNRTETSATYSVTGVAAGITRNFTVTVDAFGNN